MRGGGGGGGGRAAHAPGAAGRAGTDRRAHLDASAALGRRAPLRRLPATRCVRARPRPCSGNWRVRSFSSVQALTIDLRFFFL